MKQLVHMRAEINKIKEEGFENNGRRASLDIPRIPEEDLEGAQEANSDLFGADDNAALRRRAFTTMDYSSKTESIKRKERYETH